MTTEERQDVRPELENKAPGYHADYELDSARKLESMNQSGPKEMEPVDVRVVEDSSSVPEHKVLTGSYQTVIIPASTSSVASVVQILPRDPTRGYAYIQPIDAPIVISTSKEEAQSIANVGGTFPSGGFIGTGFAPPIRHKEAMWACNTSTSTSCRVSVMTERGRA